jgi:AhpD family alkylhydroperoxidase
VSAITPTEARIPPGTRRDVGVVGWVISVVSGRVSGTGPPNLFLTLGRHRPLFRGWLRFAGRLMPAGKLPRRETELVILRVAHLRGCAYELDHHIHLAAKAGVTVSDVERVTTDGILAGWSPREQAILATVDALHHRQDLTDAEWGTLAQHLSERECIELLLLVGHYEMLATAIGVLRIQPDAHRGG